MINREIADAKTQYYACVFQSYKTKYGKKWQVINGTLSRNKKIQNRYQNILLWMEKQ